MTWLAPMASHVIGFGAEDENAGRFPVTYSPQDTLDPRKLLVAETARQVLPAFLS